MVALHRFCVVRRNEVRVRYARGCVCCTDYSAGSTAAGTTVAPGASPPVETRPPNDRTSPIPLTQPATSASSSNRAGRPNSDSASVASPGSRVIAHTVPLPCVYASLNAASFIADANVSDSEASVATFGALSSGQGVQDGVRVVMRVWCKCWMHWLCG